MKFPHPMLLSPFLPETRETHRVKGAHPKTMSQVWRAERGAAGSTRGGAGQEDWDLLGCFETKSCAGPRGTMPSADKQAGLESGSG